jgi:hypothetical protein
MAINYPEGIQYYPAHAFHIVYKQVNTRQSFSIGNGTYELSNYQLNNIDVKNNTDVVHLNCRIFNCIDDENDEFGYGWQYKDSSGNWQTINQNNTLGVTLNGNPGHVHSTHNLSYARYGGPVGAGGGWGIFWKPGTISGVTPGTVDVRPVIFGHNHTGNTMTINGYYDGFNASDSWNRGSSSWASAIVYIADGVN